MSSELNVKLKRKGQKHNDAVTLLWMSTTPTRELCAEVDLLYNGGISLFDNHDITISDDEYDLYTVLTSDKLEEIILFYNNKINNLLKSLKQIEDKNIKLENLLMNARTSEVYSTISKEILTNTQTKIELQELIEDYTYYKNYWIFAVQNVFENNKLYLDNDIQYELVYYRD